ncbi:MAG: alpha/beta fold hydrolase [Anaerolineae bacterium]
MLRIVLAVVGLVIVSAAVVYRRWLTRMTQRASAETQTVETARGPVEYDRRGSGPVVLHFHGGNVGHNGWFSVGHVAEAGFTLLTPDRPGYLGTPLADHGSPEAQADVAAALLDALGIDQVAVAGVSAGGPPAIQFALRYPQRTDALVLIAAITQRTALSDDQLNSALGRLVMSPRLQDPAYFLINLALKLMPRLALQDFVRTETTYDMTTGKQWIERIMADPQQRQQVRALADAIVPALPRFDGVQNDLHVQQTLEDLPLTEVGAPTLIVHSRHDGDVPYDNATHAHAHIPGAELLTVEQFGHMNWWGDPQVTRDFEARIEAFLSELVAM